MTDGATRKCVIWDLDGSVWDGVLMEDASVRLRPGAADLIRQLDERGILQAVASRNDPELALAALDGFGLREYFLVHQIHWRPKSESVRVIADELGVTSSEMALIDDQAFERDEVRSRWPALLCLDAADLHGLASHPELTPTRLSDEARRRRLSYAAEQQRQSVASEFSGESEGFLRALNLRLTIERASVADLDRLHELTVRTHQLNSTGRIIDREALTELIHAPTHLVLVGSLTDSYGDYGRIALAVIYRSSGDWLVQLLLTSCRVLSRGVGTHFLTYLIWAAVKCRVRLRAEFMPTSRNRSTLVMLRFAGFVESDTPGILEWCGGVAPEPPSWLHLSAVELP